MRACPSSVRIGRKPFSIKEGKAPRVLSRARPTPAQVGRKPFNIKESENLRYAVTPLQEAPGLKDPR